VVSNFGQGTTFIFDLPINAQEDETYSLDDGEDKILEIE